MRKKILLIIALCGFYGVGAAQQSDDTTDRIRFGVKGGASFSNMKYSNLDQYDKSGVIGGVGGGCSPNSIWDTTAAFLSVRN